MVAKILEICNDQGHSLEWLFESSISPVKCSDVQLSQKISKYIIVESRDLELFCLEYLIA